MQVARWACIAGFLAWCVHVVLNPLWAGCSYNPWEPGSATTAWFPGGVFGLENAAGYTKQAPIWTPPAPHSELIQAPLRWPWQPPSGPHHIEIVVPDLVIRMAYGFVAMGVVLRALAWRFARHRPDFFLSMAWSFALAVAAAGSVLAVLAILTFGYALEKPGFLTACGTALVLGVFGGFRHDKGMRRRWNALQSGSVQPPA